MYVFNIIISDVMKMNEIKCHTQKGREDIFSLSTKGKYFQGENSIADEEISIIVSNF